MLNCSVDLILFEFVRGFAVFDMDVLEKGCGHGGDGAAQTPCY